MGRFFRCAPLLAFGGGLLLLLISGRAEGADRMIATEYKPKAKVKTAPADIPPARIFFEDFKDERSQPQQVGENLENKGKRVLIVTADPRAVGQLVRSALQTELRKKGFPAADRPEQADKILSGAVLKFWTVETTRYNTQTEIRVEVRDGSGKTYYSKMFAGTGKNFGRSLSEVNYNESFSDSLVMIVDTLLGDPEFLKGLAEKPLPPPPAAEKRIAKPAPPVRSPDPPVRQDPLPPVKPAEPAAPPPSPPVKAAAPPPPAPTRAVQESSPLPARAALPETAAQGLPPAPAVAGKERPAVGAFIEHLVVPGETLATIAKWYTGETTAWTEIAKHNPGLHPFRLKGGDLVQVPRSLATVHTEQPAHSTAPETVSRPARKTPKAPPAPPPPAATPEPAQPAFGPK